jgi:hypothetical protein
MSFDQLEFEIQNTMSLIFAQEKGRKERGENREKWREKGNMKKRKEGKQKI